jgi:integrase/recombinase XerD
MTAPAPVPPGLAAPLRTYLDHLVVERGLARNSLLAYRRDLDRYVDYLVSRGITRLPDVTSSDITGFVGELRSGTLDRPALAASSAARMTSAVRGWHRFAVEEGVTEGDPAALVRPTHQPRPLPKALSVDEIESLLDAASLAPRVETGLRDRALLELLYATGARISEAVSLDLDDVAEVVAAGADARAGLRLRGKGGKDRTVPVGRAAGRALSDYVVRGRASLAQRGTGSPALFINVRGDRLSRQTAWQVLQDAADRAGLGREVSPHVLRHSCATHLLEGGADVRVVQEILGHASVATTQIYTMITADGLREVHAASHPRGR